MRSNRASLAANPVLVGAVTTLIVVVAVFLSYNANKGLPFVPTYDLNVVVPGAAELVVGNDVRIGGSRVGLVKAIEARPGIGNGPPRRGSRSPSRPPRSRSAPTPARSSASARTWA